MRVMDKAAIRRRVAGTGDCLTPARTCARAWRRAAVVLAVLSCAVAASAGPAAAQTYNQAIQGLLAVDPTSGLGCGSLVGTSPREPNGDHGGSNGSGSPGEPVNFGSQLATICGPVSPGPGGSLGSNSSSGTGATVLQFAVPSVQQRLVQAREEAGSGKTGGGASADGGGFALALTDRMSVFVSTGYRWLEKDNNRFEDGYSSDIVNLTVGADYRLTDWFVAGAAFTYINFDGRYDDSGGFEQNSYGGILYASFTPIANGFIDVVVSYAGNNQDEHYTTSYTNEAGVTFGGRVRGDFDGEEIGTGFQSGYDVPIGNFTVGPRFGVNYLYSIADNYTQSGNSGLELVYYGDSRSSLQSNLGAQASVAISTDFGVVVPQIGLAWVHEYLDDSRNRSVRFAQDFRPDPVQFSYKRASPVRNWGVLDVGVSAVLPNNLQPFVNFSALVGNNRYTSFGGTLGLRVGL